MEKQKPNSGLTVLILEDETDAGILFSAIMKNLGFVPTLVCSLREAKSAIEKSDVFDLWFFDYNLPDGTSMELLRDNKLHHKEPVIICSAYLSDIEKKEASSLGVVKVLPKPINSQLIKQALAEQKMLS